MEMEDVADETECKGLYSFYMDKTQEEREQNMSIHGNMYNHFETDSFEADSIDVNNVYGTSLPYYHLGQLTTYDDNIIVMYHTRQAEYPILSDIEGIDNSSLYYAITDLISINFGATNTSTREWPSDNFILNYYVNDFVKDSYYILGI